MSYLEYNVARTPAGLHKVLALNWALILLISAVASLGFLVLYSVAGGDWRWAEPQMKRFILGLGVMFIVAMVPIWFWRNISALAYAVALVLLVAVELFGTTGGGATRWIDLGPVLLQPSELMKITLVMMLAAYYDWLPANKVSHPFWVLVPAAIILIPAALVLKQPDLGTALLLMTGGAGVLFAAGVHWGYFVAVFGSAGAGVTAVLKSRGTDWQLLKDYQFRRIDIFLNPDADPLGAGYNITQSKIALGSGGWTGKGFLQGTQARLNFLPEKHTDFIFTTLAEEFGLMGGLSLLILYLLIVAFCVAAALRMKDRFSALVCIGIAIAFFLYFAINMSMVMGMAPVVGVPLPLVSYGGSAMVVLMVGFGLVQSACVHRPRAKGEGRLLRR
ncbi:Rod shape-determining protein RodA [Jannaschia seosinensis]|uniref:Peptidoglycan glycosyltransferase MrdB n=1 Tax=Jannaschia seosinensis TaxID=313367 RepID=A0A0M7B407_9RHOB|nr:rod shape-determining protein RodA [Jannaschia seosinensis]CUH07434.1 Rod shape-determining protein RodA [Jannaschia seosinensis]